MFTKPNQMKPLLDQRGNNKQYEVVLGLEESRKLSKNIKTGNGIIFKRRRLMLTENSQIESKTVSTNYQL